MKPQIKHLIFDIRGVFLLEENAFLKVLTKLKRFNVEDAEKKINRLNVLSDHAELPFREYVKRFNDEFGFDMAPKAFLELKYKYLKFNDSLISFCKRSRFKISILSNNYKANADYSSEKLGLSKWTHKQFFSYRIGLCKPDPRIYKFVFRKLKSRPAECLFIDDEPKNIKTAKLLGARGIVFRSNRQFFRKLFAEFRS